ncbi:ATP-dependent helicase [Allonocardiopsis opalescens]|uniref:Lhr family ATP dependent helicase n=1 Tax=Allonocardiopsis opalescens TaxID=1144618 RepID=A0A2T0QFD5_9ACTN|nr:ATP-dependent helicase [Allonocardiopsis opalescens]PRY02646.1 Lhr family ATP dependent helicase [Allonocardiopsis opalescens]
MTHESPDAALDLFSPTARAWFRGEFAAPTPAQAAAWRSIGGGANTLVVAPTGAGKTLAAFLWALDRLAVEPVPADPLRRCRVLYVSPLKALAVDVQRNLRRPLEGMRRVARGLGLAEPAIEVGSRTGDTPARERRAFARRPPDVLITTPESLFLLLTSRARESLRGVRTVIVDEVHALAGTKRGAHLALSLERLDALAADGPGQRIGLSATVRPAAEVAAFLGGPRPVEVVRPPSAKRLELEVVVPVEDLSEPGAGLEAAAGDRARRRTVWPHVEERLFDEIAAHRSSIVFVNARGIAERLCARLNELAAERAGLPVPEPGRPAQVMAQSGTGAGLAPVVARAHHGSVSREERALIEEELKAGRLPAVVATSSLELGIDMGAVDLVVQVAAPPSVASGLQRVGRAGHQVEGVSRGLFFPRHRGDLLPSAVVVERMRTGGIEELRTPRNPLDVLAQQVVAMAAMDEWPVGELAALVRRAYPFAELTDDVLASVLDMLAGRYPSDAFAAFRPRLVWDREADVVAARPGAQRLAVTSGGTIPDRGLFGVFLVGAERGARVGELDEEMVYESRVGDVFVLGASSWRIEQITPDRVMVSPAAGQPGRLPFWHADAQGRPAELGRALGALTRELVGLDEDAALARARSAGLDALAARNLVAYLAEQRDATGSVPDDRTVVVERFRDEVGDWRVVVHSPFGAPVHAAWALVVAARLGARFGVEAQAVPSDDGIMVRVPDTEAPAGMSVADLVVVAADEVSSLVTAELGASALFAARFRECAARALLLARPAPGRRMPLWQQRQRSAQLLQVASGFPEFPIVLEAVRECLRDVFDVPALEALMRDIAARRVRVVEVETPQASPFARSLAMAFTAAYLYADDVPLAERRAQALTVDAGLLAQLLGQPELRELLDPEVVAEADLELARLAPDRRVRASDAAQGVERAADLLRELGPLSPEEAARRGVEGGWLARLGEAGRAVLVRVGGEPRWAAVEDVSRLRDALGVEPPAGLPGALLEPVADPLGDLLSRYARTHGPFRAEEPARLLGIGPAPVAEALERLAARGRVVSGAFRPGGRGAEWCDADVLRMLRRRSVARLRREAEPVGRAALARFVPSWQGVAPSSSAGRGEEGLLRAVRTLRGAVVPASALEALVLGSRVEGYGPAVLDALTATGEVVWAGAGALGGGDGWVALAPSDEAELVLPDPAPVAELGEPELAGAVLDALGGGGALFFRGIAERVAAAVGEVVADQRLVEVVWELVWAGLVSNDTLAPLRAVLSAGGVSARRAPGRRPALPSRSGPPTVSGRWWALPPRGGAGGGTGGVHGGAVDGAGAAGRQDAARRSAERGWAVARALLDRHGVVTRGAVVAERVAGGFGAAYPVLRTAEEAGRTRRGYFVEGLGAAQFAVEGAVDRLRGTPARTGPVLLAAADPANVYGAALPWPEASAEGHRPSRRAGAAVVLVDGELVLYVERGGRSVLSFTADSAPLREAVAALVAAVRDGRLPALTVRRADGVPVFESSLADLLEREGFHATPQGLRLRV